MKGFCFDLTKAFDLVNHSILFRKLEQYGIRGPALQWIISYLKDREQYVEIDTSGYAKVISRVEKINIGVPQGSVLGPLLFIIYVNDLLEFLHTGHKVMFVDDLSILISCNSEEELENSKGQMLSELREWLSANNLVEQEKKRQEIIFRTKNRMYADSLDGDNNVQSVSLLGIELHQHLKWKEHIHNVSKKLKKALFGIARIAKICTRETTLSAYHALFHSVMIYGIVLWGGSKDIQKFLVIQKKAIRYIMHIPNMQSCREHFKTLGILTVPSAYILETLKKTRENYLSFGSKSETHDHFTRHKNNVQTTQAKLTTSQKGINFMGPKLFNKLPENVKTLEMNSFVKKMKALLLKQTFYSVKEFLDYDLDKLISIHSYLLSCKASCQFILYEIFHLL